MELEKSTEVMYNNDIKKTFVIPEMCDNSYFF